MQTVLRIDTVKDGGLARDAGIKPYDVLLEYMGEAVRTNEQLVELSNIHSAAEEIELKVLRGKQIVTLSLPYGKLGITAVEVSHDTIASTIEKCHKAASVKATTAPSLEGYRIVETIDVISSECVFGMSFFKDFFTSMSDVFGGRSGTTQKALRDARINCLAELRIEALELGANAVIGVDLDYSEFSGQGKSMLFLVASGTAVKVEAIDQLD